MPEVFVGADADIGEGERRIVRHGNHEIGVLRANGILRAFLNHCPHQGGPVCNGMLVHKTEEIIREDRTYAGMRFSKDQLNLVCPWHGVEFDVATGRNAGDGRLSLRSFKVVNVEGNIYVVV